MGVRPILSLLGALALAAACAGPAATPTPAPTAAVTPVPTAAPPTKLVIGFVPSREASALVETIQPIADYLSKKLGIPVEGYVSTDYAAMVTALGRRPGADCGACAIHDRPGGRWEGAKLILQSERFGSATYHTQFMTNDPDRYCTDLAAGREPAREQESTPALSSTATAPTAAPATRLKVRLAPMFWPTSPLARRFPSWRILGLGLHFPGDDPAERGHRH